MTAIKISYKEEDIIPLLQHARKVMKQERTFVTRMYMVAAKVQQLSYYTRLNKYLCLTRCGGIALD